MQLPESQPARSTFDIAVAHVLDEEKAYSNNPKDRGGRTNYGITQETLDDARTAYPSMRLPQRVEELTVPQATEIYRVHFWAAIRGDELPLGISLMTLDGAVNSGPGFAARWLQQAIGVTVDGWIGVRTIAAARAADRAALISELSARRAHHYMLQDAVDDVFGLGWARRLFRTYRAAMKAAGIREV